MRHALKLHPDSRCVAVTGIDVEVERPSGGNLMLRYVVTGTIGDLRIPPVTAPERVDELWKHTCFEAFVRPSKGVEYFEFNFAPSTQWAAYRFSGYRVGMSSAREISAPQIDVQSSDAQFELQVSPGLDRLPGLSGYADWRLGLSAVIEEAGGNRSYWALAHPPGKADFHHSDCFVLRLPAAGRS
jgi:hypothetical protein